MEDATAKKPASRKARLQEQAERNSRYRQLRQCADAALVDMQAAMRNFENVSDPAVVDMYIYELQEAQTRYDYVMRQLKDF